MVELILDKNGLNVINNLKYFTYRYTNVTLSFPVQNYITF